VLAVVLVASLNLAYSQSTLTVFENGDVIDAGEVNDNFVLLDNLIDAAGVRLDALDTRLLALEDRLDDEGGVVGPAGKSAYQTWLDAGNSGDEAAFLLSLKGVKGDPGAQGPAGPEGPKGEDGANGQSAYQLWSVNNAGTEQDFIDFLVGPQGPTGSQGPQGPRGPAGADGQDGGNANLGTTKSVQNNGEQGGDTCFIGEVWLTAAEYAPPGTMVANGQLLALDQNNQTTQALFSILGSQYGGNGFSNFALPDLTDATPKPSIGELVYVICVNGFFPNRP
jgi:hypothetical protein